MTLLDKSRLLQSTILGGLLLAAAPAFAQDAPDTDVVDEVIDLIEDEDELLDDEDTVVVTGSRLRRNEFTSASPLKVLNIEDSLKSGLVDVASIVQRSSVATGTQFDNTFTGFTLDNGPGSSTVNLRGLDPERTLILLNGRRLSPAGVQGAPTRPDINLIPLTMLERTDLLTEGASAIYGADAVAGVVNFIPRTDFDGVEVDVFSSATENGGGSEFRASIATGTSSDRGSFGIGAEYYTRDKVTRGQRDFSRCLRDIEVNPDTGERSEVCVNGAFSNMVLDPINALFGDDITGDGLGVNFGVYGFDFENGGGFRLIPTDGQAGSPGLFVDGSGAAVPNTGLGSDWLYDDRYNSNNTSDDLDLLQGVDRYSIFANTSYDLQAFGDAEFYSEVLYANRLQTINVAAPQVFPSVDCSNPFIQNDPVLSATPTCGGPFSGFLDSLDLDQLIVLPRLTEANGPIDVDVQTTRAVAGIKGNLEAIIPTGKFRAGNDNFGFNLGNFTYDMWVSYDRNTGVTRRRTINEERLTASFNATQNPDGTITCEGVQSDLFAFVTGEDCVPFNFTDPTIYQENRLPEDLAAYISGLETTSTTIEQSMVSGSINGDLAYLPAGTVPFLIGFEYRLDELTSLNSFQITSGAGTGRNEPDTLGSTELFEVFMETEIPILKGMPLAEELTFTGAARWTEEQFFGALWTYRLQGVYRPTDWITSSVSYGTTYRAPNLREQNLAGATSFLGAFTDPCVASSALRPDEDDPLFQVLIDNCVAQGADPFSLGVGGAVTVPVVTGGTRELDSETSESFYGRLLVEQPWFDDFDLSLAVGYYNIEIENTVEEPSAVLILSQCLLNEEQPGLTSPFCSLITRDSNTADPGRNFISQIDATFFNTGLIETDGIDIDIRYSQDFAIGNNELTLTSELSASNVMSLRSQDFPSEPFFSDDGRPNVPHWSGDLFTTLQYNDFSLNWFARYVGSTMDDDIDPVRTAAQQAQFGTDFRTGEVIFREGFRDVEETEEQFLHDISMSYDRDTWSVIVGVRNVFDKEPPTVDEAEGYFTSANTVLGGGYDVTGRSFFARVAKTF